MDTERKFCKDTGFAQIIDESISRCPEREAIVFGDWRITYGEMGRMINKTAHLLQSNGITKGSKVAIISRNCPEFLVAEFASLKIGAVVVKINWRLTPDEMIYLLDLNEVSCVFLRAEKPEWGEKLTEHYKDKILFFRLEEVEGRSALFNLLDGQPDDPIEMNMGRDEVAFHLHTSGTTGRPKCVVYTHGGMLDEIESTLSVLAYRDGLKYQFISQLFHTAIMGAYMSLCTGMTLILMSQFSVQPYLESLVREKVNMIGVVPTVLKWILDEMDKRPYDLSNLHVINYSTCPIPPSLLERSIKKLNCDYYQSYGMTEMASIVTVLAAEDHFSDNGEHRSSVGRPIPGAQVKIVRKDGGQCDVGEVGEILVKGRGRMKEYFGQPELTEKCFVDGWYRTKDAGFLDKYGFLNLSGRKDDLIISGGENIYPMEIMNVIMRLCDDVAEAVVYGMPDETWGEHVKASIVLLPGSRLTAEEIVKFCRRNMPSFRVPKEIEFLKELPKSATGKVLVSVLKKGVHNI